MKQPILSICIPTYNHAPELEKTLSELVRLPIFRAEAGIEVVVSDNCSSDGTQELVERFVREYSDRIRYFRNAENVCDRNFELALKRGNGLFVKLANDTLMFTDEGLRTVFETVCRYREEKPILFFHNGNEEPFCRDCRTMDEFLTATTYFCTWIGSFGMWRRDMDAMSDFARASELQLIQVDVLLRQFVRTGRAIVINKGFCIMQPRRSMGGYNRAKVFGANYASILREHVASGHLSRRTFRREKFRMLYSHIIPSYLDRSACNKFPRNGFARFLFREYREFVLYWLAAPVMEILNLHARR